MAVAALVPADCQTQPGRVPPQPRRQAQPSSCDRAMNQRRRSALGCSISWSFSAKPQGARICPGSPVDAFGASRCVIAWRGAALRYPYVREWRLSSVPPCREQVDLCGGWRLSAERSHFLCLARRLDCAREAHMRARSVRVCVASPLGGWSGADVPQCGAGARQADLCLWYERLFRPAAASGVRAWRILRRSC